MAETDEKPFRKREKVVAKVDLPGIPAGTEGKVVLINGFSWIRYRVFFENGAERGSLDHRHLVRRSEWTGTPDESDADQNEPAQV